MSGYPSEPISLAEWQQMQAEREREEDAGLARSGDYYALGERRAKRALAGEQARVVAEYEARVRRRTLEEEHARRQGAVEAWAQEHFSQDELEAIGDAFYGEEAPQGESYHDAERRWRNHAERHLTRKQQREKEAVLTDERIRAMDADEYAKVWDVEQNRPRKGYRYEPGTGDPALDASLAAAGMGPMRLGVPGSS